MIRLLILTGVLLGMPHTVFAKLEVKNLQASHGPYGPVRANLEVMPQDEIFFRFQLIGVKTNPEGKTQVEETIRLTNAEGKTVLDLAGTVARPLFLGGNEMTLQVFITINANAPAGDYQLTVNLKDRISGETTSFTQKLICKPTRFAILAPRFSRDAAGKVPAPFGGMVNETVFFKLYGVGFTKKDQQVRVVMRMEVLDAEGKNILAKPIEVNGFLTKPDEAEKAIKLTFDGSLALSRVGDFKLRIVLEDLQGKQTTQFETPLRITAP